MEATKTKRIGRHVQDSIKGTNLNMGQVLKRAGQLADIAQARNGPGIVGSDGQRARLVGQGNVFNSPLKL